MKKTSPLKAMSMTVLGLFAAGSIGCTSTPKVEDTQEESAITAQDSEFSTMTDDTLASDAEAQSTPTTSDDLSLGASSSGRGH